ncbi:MBL fold metallo-hydrolase [Streptomyces sp. NPDC058464]|uniref:MBL fold metallo-hydrolase n=1 Tax=Streptomyces sp. NPDC058464 TaxID=3346511 RepID=UPI00364BFC6D
MCQNHQPTQDLASNPPSEETRQTSRRTLLGAVAASAVAAAPLLTAAPAAAASASAAPLSLVLLGTNSGPPPLADRYGISSALVVNGRTYVVDCGRGAVSQYLRAGLSMPSLTGIFLTHLHADHIVDYYAFPLLAAGASGAQGFRTPVSVYGPGPAGVPSTVAGAPGPVPGTVEMTRLAGQAYAAAPTFFMTEHIGIDPATLLDVRDVLPPSAAGASATNTAPVMRPFTVMENDDVKVTAVLVPHGAVFPAYAYRFDTDHGSVVFSGDTALTPNIVTLAQGADVLVHEALYPAGLAALGLPQSLIDHILATHTDVAELGRIASESGVGALVATHLSPGNPATVSDATWRRLLHDSADRARYGGRVVLGADLLHVPIGRGRARRGQGSSGGSGRL